MSWTCFGDTFPKARKAYLCDLCERGISPGDVHVARRGVMEGQALTSRMHVECEALTKGWTQDEWEIRTDPHEFREMLAEGASS